MRQLDRWQRGYFPFLVLYDSKCFLLLGMKSWSLLHGWHTSDCIALSLLYLAYRNISLFLPTIIFVYSHYLKSSHSRLILIVPFYRTWKPEETIEMIKYDYLPPVISQIEGYPACICLLPLLGTNYLETRKCLPCLK